MGYVLPQLAGLLVQQERFEEADELLEKAWKCLDLTQQALAGG